MTDFGADDPFAGASGKLKEHYGHRYSGQHYPNDYGKTRRSDLGEAGTGEPVAQTSRSGRPDNRDGWKHAASGRNGGGLRNIDGSEKDAEIELEGSTLMFGARTGIGHAGLCGNNRWRR